MINKRLLIHNCAILRPIDTDPDGNVTTERIELTTVRIVATKSTVLTSEGYTKVDTLTLYFDCTNSTPAGFIPQERDRVEWQGGSYTIKSVTPCYTRDVDVVHHYEAGLV